jgi:predicted P-loop ATPase
MLILQGPERLNKSTWLRVLAGDAYFSDSAIQIEGKEGDLVDAVSSAWIHEFAELKGLKNRDGAMIRAFLSRQSDAGRAAYGRKRRSSLRQCAFAGTTNDRYFLPSDGHNRRYWVVRVRVPVDIAWTREHRDQLLAEAVAAVQAATEGELPPWVLPADVEDVIRGAAAEHEVPTPEVDALAGLNLPAVAAGLALRDILNLMGIGAEQHGRRAADVAELLLRRGWTSRRQRSRQTDPLVPPSA